MINKLFLIMLVLFAIGFFSLGAIVDLAPAAPTCYQTAYSRDGLFLTEEASIRLCSGASSANTPIDCFNDAVFPEGLVIYDSDVIQLCSGATSASAPIGCFWQIYSSDSLELSFEEAVSLCQHANSDSSPIDCFRIAHLAEEGLRLSVANAIDLCSGS